MTTLDRTKPPVGYAPPTQVPGIPDDRGPLFICHKSPVRLAYPSRAEAIEGAHNEVKAAHAPAIDDYKARLVEALRDKIKGRTGNGVAGVDFSYDTRATNALATAIERGELP